MGKRLVDLKLKDMYAVKHALQYKLDAREQLMDSECPNVKIDLLKKDIEHEKRLIEKFQDEIEIYEDIIRR